MKKENPQKETVGKPIVIEELLKGTGLYNPETQTEFTLTIICDKPRTNGQVGYLRKEMKNWIANHAETSGISLRKEIVVKKEKNCIKFTFEFTAKGSISTKSVWNPNVKRMFVGQFKKMLGEILITNFPLQFNKDNPLFGAGNGDIYQVKLLDEQENLGRNVSIITSNETFENLKSSLEDKFPITLLCITHKVWIGNKISNVFVIVVKWNIDTNGNARMNLCNAINKHLTLMDLTQYKIDYRH